MLIITRYSAEAFYIGDDIKVTILGSNDGQVRIGIDAPKEVAILREEIREKYKNNSNGNK